MKSFFPAYCILLLVTSLLITPEAMCVSPDESAGNLFLADSGNRLTKNPFGASDGGIEIGRNDNLFYAPVPGPKYSLPGVDTKEEPIKPDRVFNAIIVSDLLIFIFAWILMFCFFRRDCIGTTE